MAREDGAPARFGELVGQSPAMRALFAAGERHAQSDAALCIQGEIGTGKDALARAIHHASASARASGAYVVVDCSGLPGAAVERELLGAGTERLGALVRARGGTLVLDRLTELPLGLQPHLVDALTREPSVRGIALTREKLASQLERGLLVPGLRAHFALELTLPPLRERREDIPSLARHLLARSADARELALTSDAFELLAAHDWPGNVRELRNVLERFVDALQQGEPSARRLGALWLAGELPLVERRAQPAAGSDFEPGASYREERARFEADFERRYVAFLLERHDGNLSAAARDADMDRKYLDKLARKHGLKIARS